MKKILISRWLTLCVLFAFLFNACSTSMQAPTTTTVPTRTYAPTETFTPEPTATQTETAIASSTLPPPTNTAISTNEAVTATTAEAGVTKSMIVLDSKNNLLYIADKSLEGKDSPVVRGLTYAEIINGQGGVNWIVTPIIIKGQGSSFDPAAPVNVPPDSEFNVCSSSNRLSCQVTPDKLNDGSFAAWVRKTYNLGSNDTVLIGVNADSKILTDSWLKQWSRDISLEVVTNDWVGGHTGTIDELTQGYLDTHPQTPANIISAADTGNFSQLDGAVIEVKFGISH